MFSTRSGVFLSRAQKICTNLLGLRFSSMFSVSDCKKYLVIDNEDSELKSSKFPLLWIRDNCMCESCFHKSVNRRIINWHSFPFKSLALSSHSFDKGSGEVQLQWNDGHESKFKIKFFESHKFDKGSVETYQKTRYRAEKVPWSKKDREFRVPRFNLEEVLFNKDQVELKNWLAALSTSGLAILENYNMIKKEDLMSDFISKLFGFCKETHYGQQFIVQHRKTDITNVAYQNSNLQSHIDLPYYEFAPGVTILHFLRQSVQGGLSTLVDGFWIAERMRKEHPAMFDVLATTPVNWVDKGVENGLKFHKIFIQPVIGLKNGKLDRINFSVPQRDSFFSVDDPVVVHEWYEAMKVFMDIAKEEILEFKINENDFLSFDNIRLMHGRTEYRADEERTLVGCYLDWDEIYSKYRAIEN